MFSSDIAKVRIAELKANGDAGTVQRLRKSCDDAAAVMGHTAKLVAGRPMSRKQRAMLADELRHGASLLRTLARVSPPKGAK